MYDIVYLSYYEPHAEKNWKALSDRFPRARRVSGVTGLVNAHKAAARACNTRWFWVVDADNVVSDDFDFSFTWDRDYPPKDAVSVWSAKNSGNGLEYGYGGIKLLPRRRVLEISDDVVDFTTSLSENFFHFPEVASITITDSSPYEAWKNGFREAAKLASGVVGDHNADTILDHWCSKAVGPYADLMIAGARAGRDYTNSPKADLYNLNDFGWLKRRYADYHSSPNTTDILVGLSNTNPDNKMLSGIVETYLEFPEANWIDALSTGQMDSKRWLVEELTKIMNNDITYKLCLDTIYVCASWYGLLGGMLLDEFGDDIGEIIGLDIDVGAVRVANRLSSSWNNGAFSTTVRDIYDLSYTDDSLVFFDTETSQDVTHRLAPTMVINTSCEHLADFEKWYDSLPDGIMVVLQSNNFFDHHEHVNCVSSMNEFALQTPMQIVLYNEPADMEKYTRYMRIGIK